MSGVRACRCRVVSPRALRKKTDESQAYTCCDTCVHTPHAISSAAGQQGSEQGVRGTGIHGAPSGWRRGSSPASVRAQRAAHTMPAHSGVIQGESRHPALAYKGGDARALTSHVERGDIATCALAHFQFWREEVEQQTGMTSQRAKLMVSSANARTMSLANGW